MNTPENLDSTSEFNPEKSGNIEGSSECFQNLFYITLVALLILSVSWNIFLVRQTSFIRNDLKTVRPQIGQLIANYQKAEDPEIKRFVNALVGFGRNHPDFNPILIKYKVPLTQTPTSAVAPSAAPAEKKK